MGKKKKQEKKNKSTNTSNIKELNINISKLYNPLQNQLSFIKSLI